MTENTAQIRATSHTFFKRIDEREPEKRLNINLDSFMPNVLPKPSNLLKLHQLFEKQACLPATSRLRLWRHARGTGDDPAESTVIGSFK